MEAICQSCGKSHQIRTENIRGQKAKLRCTDCNSVTSISIPDTKALDVDAGAPTENRPSQDTKGDRQKGIGLRTKMAFLFVVIPILLVAGSGLIHLNQMDRLSTVLTQESTDILEKMAREIIMDKARTVAVQCGNYLDSNPHLKREDFLNDSVFASIAMQKVGKTGYTCLYSIPDETGSSSLWVHPNRNIIGIDLPKAMRKPLGDRYSDWFKVYQGAYWGRESMGKYLWKDKDGQYREKFMVCTPIKNSPNIVASTTYMDEFTKDVTVMRRQAEEITGRSRTIAFAVIAATLLVLAVTVTLFSTKLSKRIRTLTSLAERISLGELDTRVKDGAKDEIGQLASAVERMRNSIRISMKRLRNLK